MVIDFSKISKNDVMTAGGKGANLGEMISAGINVPSGFVVTADEYKEFLRINGLEEIFEKELTEAGKDEARLLKAAEKFRTLIKKGKLSENPINEVKTAYKNLGENIRVAVRSSATAEDLPDASFAGQQETYLNVRGIDETVDKIIDCYASLWGNRAVSYRANQGYNQLSVAIAVVIQTLPKDVKGINRRIFKLFKTIKMLKDYEYCAGKCEGFMKQYEKEIRELRQLDFEKMYTDECREFLVYSLDLLQRLSYDRFKYALFPSALNKDLEKVLKKADTEHTVYDLYRNLDNKTAVVSRDVENLAKEVKKSCLLKKAIISGESFETICKNFPEFKNLTDEFLNKNGFKSDYNCYCIEGKTFLEDKDRLINIMKPLILQEDNKKEDTNDFSGLLAEIEKVAGQKYVEIKKRIDYFRYFHIVREESQYLWETLFYYVRKCLKRTNSLLLGNEDYKVGVANLFQKELTEALKRGYLNDSDKEKINRRNQKYPLAVKVWEASKALAFDSAGEVLKGVSGSKGIAVGTARLIKEPKEFYKMKKGDILVCHFTDPEWTPLFGLAGAVVADTGSALSHADIVAREYGIPAVLGVGFATVKFKDGDRIRVDGDKGEVSKI